MAKLITIPSHIIEVKKVDFSEKEELLYNTFIEELKKYCEENSTCPHAGQITVTYSENNQDKHQYFGADHMIFDYDSVFQIDGDCAVYLSTSELELLDKEMIINNLNHETSNISSMPF